MMVWRQLNQAEQAARWAGLATMHDRHIPSRLLDPVRMQLEQDLGVAHYQRAYEQGRLLSLVGVVNEILVSLD